MRSNRGARASALVVVMLILIKEEEPPPPLLDGSCGSSTAEEGLMRVLSCSRTKGGLLEIVPTIPEGGTAI